MAGFGAYHGLNPAMGWLFALALGLQQRSASAIWLALPPIALGHAASVGLVAGAVLALGRAIPFAVLDIAAAVVLLAFGAWKLRRWARHPRWVGMRVGARDLVGWSFLMAAGHGAGLMVAPVLLAITDDPARASAAAELRALGLAVAAHTLAMLVVMAAVAWIVYRKLGLAVLRRGWVNFDLIWAAALLLVGALALARGVWTMSSRG
ncbi:MAG TPA: hypothetical protein VF041_20680 [Gemmatimonadaceae bacterium]